MICLSSYLLICVTCILYFSAKHRKDVIEKRGAHVMKNIVRVALTVVKSKHFETQIASHISTGSDMEEIGHIVANDLIAF